jgi:hypothetical protein
LINEYKSCPLPEKSDDTQNLKNNDNFKPPKVETSLKRVKSILNVAKDSPS